MAADTYTVLEGAERIRQNIGMYIGSDENATQLVTEILDNMFDEIASKRANLGKIYFQADGSCWISDNGKGIHVYPMTLANGDVKDSVEILCTEVHSGSKFDNDEYDTHIGMHGVGLVAVNALSDWLVIKTRDRDNRDQVYEYVFQDFSLYSKKESVEPDDKTWSTIIGFKPSTRFFESIDFDKKNLLEKMVLCQAKYNHCQFYINDKPLPKRTFNELVRQQLGLTNDQPLYELESNSLDPKGKPMVLKCYITYIESQDEIDIGDVNLRPCTGKYLDHFKALLKDKIAEKIGKKYTNIDPKLLLLGLRCYLSLTVPRAKFDAQVKTKMTLNVKEPLISPLDKQVDWFLNQRNIIPMIQLNVDLRVKRNQVKTSTSRSKRVSGKNKLEDCINTPGETLYIVEGDSAGGIIDQVRDKLTEAYFPARGKILNVENCTLEKIQNNEEINMLIEALGPREKRRYKYIKLLADPDPDGHHIIVLFLLVLQKIASDYLSQGRVKVVIPPLYSATKGNQYIPVYDHAETDQYRSKGYSITRFKGLGEMSPEELDITLQTKMEWTVTVPELESQRRALFEIVTDTTTKRALMNDDRCSFETVLRKVREANQTH